jgi:hypothetical protein
MCNEGSSSSAAVRFCAGIERRLQAETGLAVTIAEEPLTRVAVGAGRSLEEARLHTGFAKGALADDAQARLDRCHDDAQSAA